MAARITRSNLWIHESLAAFALERLERRGADLTDAHHIYRHARGLEARLAQLHPLAIPPPWHACQMVLA